MAVGLRAMQLFLRHLDIVINIPSIMLKEGEPTIIFTKHMLETDLDISKKD